MSNKKQELSLTVSELRGPTISGEVSVPLVELDRMRADHANAIATAKELERHQAEVRIICVEREVYTDYDEPRREGGRFATKTRFNEVSREYKGFDEFRSLIQQEELEKVNSIIDSLQKSKDTWYESYNRCQKDLGVSIEKIKGLEIANEESEKKVAGLMETLKLANEQNARITAKWEIVLETCNEQERFIKGLHEKIETLEYKKGFWSFLSIFGK